MHFRSGRLASLFPGVNSSKPMRRCQGFVGEHGCARQASAYHACKASDSSNIIINRSFGLHSGQRNGAPSRQSMSMRVRHLLNLAEAICLMSVLLGASSVSSDRIACNACSDTPRMFTALDNRDDDIDDDLGGGR